MTPLIPQLLAFFAVQGAPGRSPYSFEALLGCGTNPETPACALERVCDVPGPLCAPPRWSKVRGAWVRVESRETALKRWEVIFASAERVGRRLVDCQGPDGSVIEDCRPVAGWPRGRGRARQLTLALVTTAFWESGLREDIEFGYPPAGRGGDGEACLIQVMPDQIPPAASWLSKEDRSRPWKRPELEKLAQSLLGDSPEALDRCFEVGARHLARARRSCSGKGLAWDYGMWSRYGTGDRCTSAGSSLGDFAALRSSTLHKLRASLR